MKGQRAGVGGCFSPSWVPETIAVCLVGACGLRKGCFVQLWEAPAAWDGSQMRRVVIYIKCLGSHRVGGRVMMKNVNNCQRALLYSNGLE